MSQKGCGFGSESGSASANGARRIARIETLAASPRREAEHLGRLLDEPAAADRDGWRVCSGAKRADFVFYDQAGLARRYPDAARAGAVSEGPVALAIQARDQAAVATTLGSRGIAHDGMISAPASAANGMIVSFTSA